MKVSTFFRLTRMMIAIQQNGIYLKRCSDLQTVARHPARKPPVGCTKPGIFICIWNQGEFKKKTVNSANPYIFTNQLVIAGCLVAINSTTFSGWIWSPEIWNEFCHRVPHYCCWKFAMLSGTRDPVHWWPMNVSRYINVDLYGKCISEYAIRGRYGYVHNFCLVPQWSTKIPWQNHIREFL